MHDLLKPLDPSDYPVVARQPLLHAKVIFDGNEATDGGELFQDTTYCMNPQTYSLHFEAVGT